MEEQIGPVLRHWALGTPVAQVRPKMGISDATLSSRRRRFMRDARSRRGSASTNRAARRSSLEWVTQVELARQYSAVADYKAQQELELLTESRSCSGVQGLRILSLSKGFSAAS